jgi:hypothetical protein
VRVHRVGSRYKRHAGGRVEVCGPDGGGRGGVGVENENEIGGSCSTSVVQMKSGHETCLRSGWI